MPNPAVVTSETTTIIPVPSEGGQRAFKILQFAFTAAPLIAGLDKFFNFLVDWRIYLSPLVTRFVGAEVFMRLVGVIEIAAGILMIFRPRLAAQVVTVWLWAIILNLLTTGMFYDIALRDFGLSLGALALANLAQPSSQR